MEQASEVCAIGGGCELLIQGITLVLGDMDYVPTKLIDTVYMETASDDWFVDLNSDGLPEMAIGRLPVQTKEEAATVVSKIVGYEKSSKKKEALLVADR